MAEELVVVRQGRRVGPMSRSLAEVADLSVLAESPRDGAGRLKSWRNASGKEQQEGPPPSGGSVEQEQAAAVAAGDTAEEATP